MNKGVVVLIGLVAVAVIGFVVWQAQRPVTQLPSEPMGMSTEAKPAQPTPPPATREPEPAPAAPSRPAPAGRGELVAKRGPAVTEKAPDKESSPAALRLPAEQQVETSAPARVEEKQPPLRAELAERSEPAAPTTPLPTAPPAPRTVTIPAGTLISVRLAETLDTGKVKAGDSFTATLDKPLIIDGLIIAERGARAEGRVLEAERAGRLKGVASLSIHLTRIHTSDGQVVQIPTDPFRKEGETSRGEDARKVGIMAGIGAAIGAIAGGGRGAAIGAGVGGAAGAGTVAATRGHDVVLPVETRIDFRVSSPVTITEKR